MGQMYDARWRTTRSERRKKMRVKRAQIAEKLGALLDETLVEAEKERRKWAVMEELERVAAAWEISAKDLKWRTPAEMMNFLTSKMLKSERVTNPFREKRVKRILKAIEIGGEVMEEQRIEVEELLKKYTDVFTLDVGEMFPVDWASHKLEVDLDTKLPKNTPIDVDGSTERMVL